MEDVTKRQYDTQERRKLAEEGKALPDGSFPIVDKTDLMNALQSIGRAGNRAFALRHIRARAKDLGLSDALPEWAMEKALPLADEILLNDLRQFSDLTDEQWGLLEDEVVKAGGVLKLSGYAMDEVQKAQRQSFGGNRSAAGQYAASVRWSRNRGSGESGKIEAGSVGGGGSRITPEESVVWAFDDVENNLKKAQKKISAKLPPRGKYGDPGKEIMDARVETARSALDSAIAEITAVKQLFARGALPSTLAGTVEGVYSQLSGTGRFLTRSGDGIGGATVYGKAVIKLGWALDPILLGVGNLASQLKQA